MNLLTLFIEHEGKTETSVTEWTKTEIKNPCCYR